MEGIEQEDLCYMQLCMYSVKNKKVVALTQRGVIVNFRLCVPSELENKNYTDQSDASYTEALPGIVNLISQFGFCLSIHGT